MFGLGNEMFESIATEFLATFFMPIALDFDTAGELSAASSVSGTTVGSSAVSHSMEMGLSLESFCPSKMSSNVMSGAVSKKHLVDERRQLPAGPTTTLI
jgi:hypothetical protein